MGGSVMLDQGPNGTGDHLSVMGFCAWMFSIAILVLGSLDNGGYRDRHAIFLQSIAQGRIVITADRQSFIFHQLFLALKFLVDGLFHLGSDPLGSAALILHRKPLGVVTIGFPQYKKVTLPNP